MATQQELVNKIQELDAKVTNLQALLANLVSEMSAAFGRFLAKLAAGVDTQAEIDALNVIGGKLNTLESDINNATSQAQVEGQ